MKIENDYLVFEENDKPKFRKIFSSTYPSILGVNKFKPRGDAILEMLSLAPKDPFNEFYSLRGYYAEMIIKEYFRKKNIKHKHFGMESSGEKMFDLFTDNKVFGGVLDFLIYDDVNVEVKSTNFSKKYFVHKTKGKIEHRKQIELSSFLGGLNKAYLVYVYFTDEEEELIKRELEDGVERFKIDNFSFDRITFYDIEIANEKIKRDMLVAYDSVKKVLDNRRIPLDDISDQMLEKLNLSRPIDVFKQRRL